MKKFYIFIGTTAELIKVAPVIAEFQKKNMKYTLIATGQNNIVFKDMSHFVGSIKPDILFEDKNEKSSLLGFFMWSVRTFFSCFYSLKKEFKKQNAKDTYLIVHGDTVSSMLGAIIGRIYQLKVVHIESGLRSYNFLEPFPEEICRYITSHISTIHFCPNEWSVHNLRHHHGARVNTLQNTLYDSYRRSLKDRTQPEILRKLNGKYFVLIIHRQEHVMFEKDKTLRMLKTVLTHADKRITPVLINLSLTNRFLQNTDQQFLEDLKKRTIIIPRLPYSQFMKLLNKSEFIVTDGGSNQEESYYMGKPCVLLRNVTERIEGLGENVVLSKCEDKVLIDFLKHYKKYNRHPLRIKQYPSSLIVDYLLHKT